MLLKIKGELKDYLGLRISGSIIVNNSHTQGMNKSYRKIRLFSLNIPPVEVIRIYGSTELENDIIDAPITLFNGSYYIGDISLLGTETETDKTLSSILNESKRIEYVERVYREERNGEDKLFKYLKNLLNAFPCLSLQQKVSNSLFLRDLELISRKDEIVEIKDIRKRYNKYLNTEYTKEHLKDGKLYLKFNTNINLIPYSELIQMFQNPYKANTRAKGFGRK
ncbi:MAG: hypothetical protein R3321_04890 [Nitrososphaeraceae archaeon]|nr:hypothetical protein [Nitrososphaeraceae archaeon]